MPGKGVGLLASPIREHGRDIDEVLAAFEVNVVDTGAQPASPGHLAYIPGSGLYHAALGDYLAAISNKYASIFFSSPGAARMENMMVRWVADLVGYPATAAGSIASGGSVANLTAIVSARDAHALKGADYASSVVYLTRQAHHCVDKALRIAGMGEVQLRYLPMDSRYRMRVNALEEAIAADRVARLRPWLIVAAAGTTDTGAVDPLDAIGIVASREKCWFHVDAAYGGFFLLTEHGRVILKGIERSDSVVLDPHKSLFLPWGSGIVCVRDAAPLAAAHAYEGAYMQDALREPSEVNPADVSPELTKHFRGLRMWLPLMVAGVAPFRSALEEKLLLARYFHQEIQVHQRHRHAADGAQPRDHGRCAARRPRLSLVDDDRRAVYAAPGGAVLPDASKDDRPGGAGAPGAGRALEAIGCISVAASAELLEQLFWGGHRGHRGHRENHTDGFMQSSVTSQ